MKLLWLCNMVPGAVQEKINGNKSGGLWVDHVLSDLRQQELTIRILCPGKNGMGSLDEQCSYAFYEEGEPEVYLVDLEEQFRTELETFQPDVIHIWGTEFAHTLAMVNAAEQLGHLDHTVASIQGLCYICAHHYAEGVPYKIRHRSTFRDFLRRDNIAQQQKKYARRGELEIAALKKLRHVIGRTEWDRTCTQRIHSDIQYHFCNETLREDFYEGQWKYAVCQKHRIFASSCSYPVKGFHYLLEAFAEVLKTYPDARLAVPGDNFLVLATLESKLRQNGYQKYLAELARKYQIEDKIDFLGHLRGDEMKQAFLDANVFVMPSTIENSPNSLGEAMLLGVPCVAADVGGVSNLMENGKEGKIYPSTAPYMLAYHIQNIFTMEDRAELMGAAASLHAQRTHDPKVNLETLLAIYRELM